MRFDVSVDLTEAVMPLGMPPGRAAELVLAAVRAIPGAQFVSVEDCRGAPPGLRWITTYQPGRPLPTEGGEWEVVRERVAAAVVGALGPGVEIGFP